MLFLQHSCPCRQSQQDFTERNNEQDLHSPFCALVNLRLISGISSVHNSNWVGVIGSIVVYSVDFQPTYVNRPIESQERSSCHWQSGQINKSNQQNTGTADATLVSGLWISSPISLSVLTQGRTFFTTPLVSRIDCSNLIFSQWADDMWIMCKRAVWCNVPKSPTWVKVKILNIENITLVKVKIT